MADKQRDLREATLEIAEALSNLRWLERVCDESGQEREGAYGTVAAHLDYLIGKLETAQSSGYAEALCASCHSRETRARQLA